MITELKLRFGRTPETPAESIAVSPITVFVGPNNSGKSCVLREIEHFCRHGQINGNTCILDSLAFGPSTRERACEMIDRLKSSPRPREHVSRGAIFINSRHGRDQVHYESIISTIQNPGSDLSLFCSCFLKHYTLMLDGPSRINLVNEQPGGDLMQSPTTSFQVLFRDDIRRKEVRRIVYEALKRYFVIDPTNLGQLRIRLSRVPPDNDMHERGIHEESVRFHAAAQPIEASSDGVKAFAGIITELLAGDTAVVLMDEPEAFLHPHLAAKLGFEVARAAQRENKRVFVSTHSPQFLMGCIQSGVPLNIVRLTYLDGVATARILPAEEVLELMRHPLLRSTGVLSGLFYESVVVTESDSDRAFYQEVNERLLQYSPENGVPNCLFLNAQNKQTVRMLVDPLRRLGIPAAAIVDVDVLKEGGAIWTRLLKSADVPILSHAGLGALRSAIVSAMESTGLDMKRNGGLAILPDDTNRAAWDLWRQLASYGIFFVPGGELESWLRQLGASGHGPSWLVEMFERMGEDPSRPEYLKPSNDDVWRFMAQVGAWLKDPTRRGIPR